ncbi:PCRF domain-containing protein, partial [bacterium]|nr:PCRF domain-containing protein [bacterium]
MLLYEELLEKLKALQPDVVAIRSYWNNASIPASFRDLDDQVASADFYKQADKDTVLSKHRKLKQLIELFTAVDTGYNNYRDLLEMFKDDETELQAMAGDIRQLCKQVTLCKLALLLTEPYDGNDCFLSVNSGAGGTESQDWAEMLLRMFLRFCEREGFKTEVLDHQSGEGAGIKSATLHIKGQNAYGFLKAEAGIHRLVRI